MQMQSVLVQNDLAELNLIEESDNEPATNQS
jgi:hypothetical protein